MKLLFGAGDLLTFSPSYEFKSLYEIQFLPLYLNRHTLILGTLISSPAGASAAGASAAGASAAGASAFASSTCYFYREIIQ